MDRDKLFRLNTSEDDTIDAPAAPDERPFRSFLPESLLRPPTPEDDTDTTDNKKKKKFRGLFKRLFPRIAETDSTAVVAEKPKDEPMFDFLSLLRPDMAERPATEMTAEALAATEAMQPKQVAETTPGLPVFEAPAELPDMTAEVAPPIPTVAEYEPPVHVPEALIVPPLPPVRPRAEAPAPEKPKSIIAPVVAGIVASEFLNRRRNRKRKKEINRLQKAQKLAQQTEQKLNKRQEELHSQLSAEKQHGSQLSQRFDQLRAERKIEPAPIVRERPVEHPSPQVRHEAPAVLPKSVAEHVPKPPTAEATLEQSAAQNVTSHNIELQSRKLEVDPEPLRRRYAMTPTRETIDRPAKREVLPNIDSRRERDLERAKERPIKDRATIQQHTSSQPISVASVLSSLHQQSVPPVTPPPLPTSVAKPTSLYAQSLSYGVVAAIVLAALTIFYIYS